MTAQYNQQIFNSLPLKYRQQFMSTFSSRMELAKLGIFSIDQPEHRAKRQAEADAKRRIENAYLNIGMHRDTELKRIAAELEAHLTSGIWARSTLQYARRRAQLDQWVLDTNEAMALPETDPYHPKHWRNEK